jgi:hypothetical protein
VYEAACRRETGLLFPVGEGASGEVFGTDRRKTRKGISQIKFRPIFIRLKKEISGEIV